MNVRGRKSLSSLFDIDNDDDEEDNEAGERSRGPTRGMSVPMRGRECRGEKR